MRERVLTRRELNRALLARQLLLERADLPVRRAVEALAGLQAQWAPAPTIGLWSRVTAVERGAVERLLARKQLVRATLMRVTIHLVSTRDYLSFRPALEAALRRKWRQYRPREPEPADLAEIVGRVSEAAAEPCTAAELQALVEPDEDRFRWFMARSHAALVRTPDDRYVDAEAWLGRPFADPTAATQHLVRRYLAAFGPATAADVAAWSGLQATELRPALGALRLRQFRDDAGRSLVDLPGAPLPDGETPAPPRLLPRFDNLILSHADRTRVIEDEHRRRVIRAAEVDAVFLIDGFAAGRWKLPRGKRLVLEPFGRLAASVRRALEDEGERLAAFLAD
jgi:hypothetical protein